MNVTRDTKYAPGHIIKTRIKFYPEIWNGGFWRRSAIYSASAVQARNQPFARNNVTRVVKVTTTEEIIK